MDRRAAAVVALAALAAGVIHAQGGLASLGVSETAAKNEIVQSFAGGYVNVQLAARAIKAAAPAARATMVTTLMNWAKAYTETPAFKADYERQRQADVPQPPKSQSTDQQLAAQKTEQQKSLEEARKNLAQLPPDVRAQVEAALKQSEAQMAKMNADPQMSAAMRKSIDSRRAEEQKAYEQRVAAHDKRFPADPRVLIARRLQEFLTVSQDVDFSAKLVPAGQRMKFENPRYEAQSPEWKLCYRVGKEATAAARSAAQAWLASLK